MATAAPAAGAAAALAAGRGARMASMRAVTCPPRLSAWGNGGRCAGGCVQLPQAGGAAAVPRYLYVFGLPRALRARRSG